MARTGITYEDVSKVIENLMVNGEKPTILKIREALGGIGSPNTISKYFKQWKDKAIESNKEATNTPSSSIEPSSKEEQTITELEPIENETQPAAEKTLKSLDSTIKSLIDNAQNISSELLNTMSNEWNIILSEKNDEIKIRKLHAALIKEQTRREAAEKVAQESKIYSEVLKEQVSQRISDLKDALEAEIAFLNGQIRKLKKEAESDIDYYRTQLEKANNKLIEVVNKTNNQ